MPRLLHALLQPELLPDERSSGRRPHLDPPGLLRSINDYLDRHLHPSERLGPGIDLIHYRLRVHLQRPERRPDRRPWSGLPAFHDRRHDLFRHSAHGFSPSFPSLSAFSPSAFFPSPSAIIFSCACSRMPFPSSAFSSTASVPAVS